jgi:hypothetical protein
LLGVLDQGVGRPGLRLHYILIYIHILRGAAA